MNFIEEFNEDIFDAEEQLHLLLLDNFTRVEIEDRSYRLSYLIQEMDYSLLLDILRYHPYYEPQSLVNEYIERYHTRNGEYPRFELEQEMYCSLNEFYGCDPIDY